MAPGAERQPSQTSPQQATGWCQLCHCECPPPARVCAFCLVSMCVLIFPGGIILGAFFALIGWYFFFVPWLICASVITLRRLGHKRFGNRSEEHTSELQS